MYIYDASTVFGKKYNKFIEQQEQLQTRMNSFYFNEFQMIYKNLFIAASVRPDHVGLYLEEMHDYETKIENKMHEDGYSNVDIGEMKNLAKQQVVHKINNH